MVTDFSLSGRLLLHVGALSPVYKSAPLTQRPAGGAFALRSVTANSWADDVVASARRGHPVLVLVYSSLCVGSEQCGSAREALSVALRRLAQSPPSAQVSLLPVIAFELDLVANDLPDYRFSAPDIHLHPTLYWLAAGDAIEKHGAGPRRYEGAHDADSIELYVRSQISSLPDLNKSEL